MKRTKTVLGFCRVSSKEQQEEGVSLDVQRDAIEAFVAQKGWKLDRIFSVAESAKDADVRKVFNQMLAHTEQHAFRVDGIVFKSVDRATRNTKDLARLEALWDKHQIDVFIVDGDLRMSDLGNSLTIGIQGLMARHENLRNARKVREARERLHREGRMGHKAPYGYQNHRIGKQAYVSVHQDNGPKVRRIFEIYAHEDISVRDLIGRLAAEGLTYTAKCPRFNSSKLYKILMDRSYRGEIPTRHGWLPGVHDPLIDELTFARVQARLGQRHYTKHDIAYAGLIQCGHCQRKITGERVKRGERRYTYYRCSGYNADGHPRVRLREADVEHEVLAFLNSLRFEDPELRDWFRDAIRAKAASIETETRDRRARLRAALTKAEKREEGILSLHLDGEISLEEFATHRDRLRADRLRVESELARESIDHDEKCDAAVRAFELADRLAATWVTADVPTRRLILEITTLNMVLDDTSLVVTARSPFDLLLVEAGSENGRSERI